MKNKSNVFKCNYQSLVKTTKVKRSHKSGPDVTLAFGGGNQRKAHKMAKDSTGKLSVEAELKTLQKHMGAALMSKRYH